MDKATRLVKMTQNYESTQKELSELKNNFEEVRHQLENANSRIEIQTKSLDELDYKYKVAEDCRISQQKTLE